MKWNDLVVDDSMHMFLFIYLFVCHFIRFIKYFYLAVIYFYFSFSKVHLNPNTVPLQYIHLPPHFECNAQKTTDGFKSPSYIFSFLIIILHSTVYHSTHEKSCWYFSFIDALILHFVPPWYLMSIISIINFWHQNSNKFMPTFPWSLTFTIALVFFPALPLRVLCKCPFCIWNEKAIHCAYTWAKGLLLGPI